MSKFVVVKEAPTELKKGEYVIGKPSFHREITMHKTKFPRNGLSGSHYIRMVVDSVSQAYDPENMSAYSVKAHNYEGRKISTDDEINDLFVEMFKADYPAVFTKYLDVKIKSRPAGTSLVIYVDSDIKDQYETFYKNGLSQEKLEVLKKEKSNKVVGKPAVKGQTFKVEEDGTSRPMTDEEVDKLNAAEIISETTHTTKY